MESQPQNPEFRINPENFHPCFIKRNFPDIHRAKPFDNLSERLIKE